MVCSVCTNEELSSKCGEIKCYSCLGTLRNCLEKCATFKLHEFVICLLLKARLCWSFRPQQTPRLES